MAGTVAEPKVPLIVGEPVEEHLLPSTKVALSAMESPPSGILWPKAINLNAGGCDDFAAPNGRA
jgi:hypothetical protein